MFDAMALISMIGKEANSNFVGGLWCMCVVVWWYWPFLLLDGVVSMLEYFLISHPCVVSTEDLLNFFVGDNV